MIYSGTQYNYLQQTDLKAILIISHAIYWFIILVRYIVKKIAQSTGKGTLYNTHVAQKAISSPQAKNAVSLTSFSIGLYYVLLVIWIIQHVLTGNDLFEAKLSVQIAGLALMGVAIFLRIWVFVIFRSWRTSVEIAPGHQLITSGPYAWIRHPLYLSILVLFVSSFLLLPRFEFLCQLLLVIPAYVFRIHVEEEILIKAFPNNYLSYMRRTYRLLPFIY